MALAGFIIYKTNISFLSGIECFGTIVIMYLLGLKLYRDVNKYTDYGKEQLSQIHGYVRFLKHYGDFKSKGIEQIELWEDAYIYAIAFHIPIKGIYEFIGDEVRYNEIREGVRERLERLFKSITAPVIGLIVASYFINPVDTIIVLIAVVVAVLLIYSYINRRG